MTVTAIDTRQKTADSAAIELPAINRDLAGTEAHARVAWALARFRERVVMSSSFGAQSAVMLHLVTRQRPDIPVVLVDTGYLFTETYRFIDALSSRLALNLHVHRANLSPAWQEARYGRLWAQGPEGLEAYNRLNKVEPMRRALEDLGAQAWLSGLRRQQASTRADLGVISVQNDRYKVHPIVDWTDRDVYRYLKRHNLPYHPLWHEGYVSIGDWHTTRRLADGMDAQDTRFFGLMRECGLHVHV